MLLAEPIAAAGFRPTKAGLDLGSCLIGASVDRGGGGGGNGRGDSVEFNDFDETA